MKQKLIYLFSLMLMCIVGTSGALADTAVISSPSESVATITSGIVTLTDLSGKTGIQSGSGSFTVGGTSYTPAKLSGARNFELTFEEGYTVTSIKVYATTNSDETGTAGTTGNDGMCDNVPAKNSTPVEIDYTGQTRVRFSAQSLAVIVVEYSSAATTAPTFTTDLSATADVTVGVAETFTIVADGATSYQWYTCDDAEGTNAAAIDGATSASYEYTATAAGTEYIYCVATNSIDDTPSTICAVTASAPASAPTIDTNLESSYDATCGVALPLSIVATDASSYQWYKASSTTADLANDEVIDGATAASYSYTATSTGTEYIYCAATNAAGTTTSVVAAITATKSDNDLAVRNSSLYLIPSGTKTLSKGKYYTTSSDGAVTFASSATDVVTVGESTGVITVVGEGTATITVTQAETASMLGGSQTITVKVGKANAFLYSVTTTSENTIAKDADLTAYGTLTTGAAITAVATNDNFTSKTNKNGYIALGTNSDGIKIKMAGGYTLNEGDVVIVYGKNGGSGNRSFAIGGESTTSSPSTVTSAQGDNSYDYEYTYEIPEGFAAIDSDILTVWRLAGKSMYIKGIEVIRFTDPDTRNESDLTLTSDASVQIDETDGTADVTWTTSADNSNVTIASSNTSVATVEKTGEGTATITAVAEGTCTITITQEGDENYQDDTKTITVTVGNPATAINYAIDFTKSWAADLNTSGAASQCWVTSISDGVPTYETSAPSDYLMYFKGYYKNSTYGIYYGAQFQIPVTAGSYKITLGCSDYGGNVPVTDGTNTLTSINNSGGKYAQSSSNISYGYVTVDEACTLYLTAPNNNVYFPYFAIEAVDEVPSAYTVTFMNGETEVSSSTIYEGTSIGSLPSDPNTNSSKQFIGWYTALDGTGEFATTATVPTADVTYYANILDITTSNGYVVVDNSGNDGRNGESFKAAIVWANANSGYDVFVPNGTYDLGDQISASITGVTITRQMAIVGESTDGVLVKAETEAENESINTATIKIDGSVTGAYLQNMTIQNYAKALHEWTDDSGNHSAERALALWDRGTQTVLKNVYLRGTQDVYYTNRNGEGQLTYYENGKIEGTVDFICGAGNAFFESVNLHAASSATYAAAKGSASTTYIAAPATYESENGYVFNNCTITGEADQAGRYYLVRTWQNAAKTTYIDVDYSACAPIAALYKTMNSSTTTDNCHSYSSSDAEAANYTATAVLGSTFYNSAKSTIATYTNDVTVGSTGFATIGFPYATTIPENVTAYAITGLNGSTLTTTKITAGSTVAANTGLMISAAPGTYTFAARPDGTEYASNILVATGTETPTFSTAGEIYFLTITDATNKKVGWKLNNAGRTLKKYSAYIPATSVPSGLSVLTFTLDDATAIDGVTEQSEVTLTPAYNIAGQRVNANAKGMVIINGQKVVNE